MSLESKLKSRILQTYASMIAMARHRKKGQESDGSSLWDRLPKLNEKEKRICFEGLSEILYRQRRPAANVKSQLVAYFWMVIFLQTIINVGS